MVTNINPDKIDIILATDCGSTTSKARFFRKIAGEYRFIAAGEAPTTVEAPYEDVTLGARNAVREIEELIGHKLLASDGIISPSNGKNRGVDLYVTTSSAGGGLQMMVCGVAKILSATSAERVALGAGAIVMDVLAVNDGYLPHEKIQRMRFLRPDMILFAGGTDGGSVAPVIETADFIISANPQARFGSSFQLPIVYAGNKEISKQVNDRLGSRFALKIVANLRPDLDVENPEPARSEVHEVFMEHVMSHAPGYIKLMKWTPVPIMPTPMGEGVGFQTMAKMYRANVIGVGLGGATTNVYSVYDGRFVRTVSANLGMSYSIRNVLKETGMKNIMRWIPFKVDEEIIYNKLQNKMIRPTTIPNTLEELIVEHAVAREALRLGFIHHKLLAKPILMGRRDISSSLEDREVETYIEMMNIGWICGTGGLLSHAPRRVQSFLILTDGFQPEGITNLAQDSVFMMPHLGVLSTVHLKAAVEIFDKDCLVRLGTCIAFKGQIKEEKEVAEIRITMPNGEVLEEKPIYGTIRRIPLSVGESAKVEIRPIRGFDVGQGSGRSLSRTVTGGVVGIVIDARGRPLELPEDDEQRQRKLLEWLNALDVYPSLKRYGQEA